MAQSSIEGQMPSPRIQRLPDALIERIAAGEVIESPASVVRELLDNALDAGATGIRVELREGGLRLVRVADDGHGIAPDELALAVAPHASSKVATLDDLTRIRTLGFRGEALASIAAVAELEIASATDDSGLAATLSAGPDGTRAHSTVARARGTTVTVRDVFETVPARRALFRGARGETARVLSVVRAYALAHPDVRFLLVADGLLVLQTHGTNLAAAVAALYGADPARSMRPIGPVVAEPASITGAIGERAFTFPGRDHVVVVVNGRTVSNRALIAAAEAGYRTLLRKGRHPLLVLHIEVPPERVDPSVHPAKAEVLLRGEVGIAAALRDAIHAALGAAPLNAGQESSSGLRARPIQLHLPTARRRHRTIVAEGARGRYAAVPPSAATPDDDIGGLTAIGQFDDTLIVARSPHGSLYLVDQHRAHERMLYEQLKLRRESGHGASGERPEESTALGAHQLLLEPMLVELTLTQAARLSHRVGELASLGLECQPFGGSVFLVRSLPDVPGAAQSPAAFAAELALAAAEDSDDWMDAVSRSLACRSAIRRGETLTLGQQQHLLDGLAPLTARAACPHGSPLLLRLSASYLAHTFEW